MYEEDGGGFVSQASQDAKKNRGGQQALVPVTIKMILSAESDGEDFIIDNRPVSQVKIIGNVMRIDPRATCTVYTIEDSTGAIDVTQWMSSGDEDLQTLQERREKMQPQTYVAVVGQLKSFDGRVTLSAFDIRPMDDHNEITHHFLEAIYVHARALKQPEFDQKAAAAAQFGAAPPVSAAMDQSNDNNGGLTNVQFKILEFYNVNGTSDEGLNINFVIRNCVDQLNVSAADVKAAVDVLTSEGHLYSTLDDDHHKSTDSD